MNEIDQQSDDRDLKFAGRTMFVPARILEIRYHTRKRSSFPYLQEMVLRVLNILQTASLDLLSTYLALPGLDISRVLDPLVSSSAIVENQGEFRLSDYGKKLFEDGDGCFPAFTESKDQTREFTVDDHCGLPIEARNLGDVLKWGAVSSIFTEVPVDKNDKVRVKEKVMDAFNQRFQDFIRDEELQDFREGRLELHKVDYCNSQKKLLVDVHVVASIGEDGRVGQEVTPFDQLVARTERRRELRNQLVETIKVPSAKARLGEIAFIRRFFGRAFLDGCQKGGEIDWSKFVAPFFENKDEYPRLVSGLPLLIGDLNSKKNSSVLLGMIDELAGTHLTRPNELSHVVWIRPKSTSWGRSLQFIETMMYMRQFDNIVLELWEKYSDSQVQDMPRLKDYSQWFNELHYFDSEKVPDGMEIILIGSLGGIVMAHGFTPPGSSFDCPIGVSFSARPDFLKYLYEELSGTLRSVRAQESENRSKKKNQR
jgi:hypothetical protein